LAAGLEVMDWVGSGPRAVTGKSRKDGLGEAWGLALRGRFEPASRNEFTVPEKKCPMIGSTCENLANRNNYKSQAEDLRNVLPHKSGPREAIWLLVSKKRE
jgi:hypothetical protein